MWKLYLGLCILNALMILNNLLSAIWYCEKMKSWINFIINTIETQNIFAKRIYILLSLRQSVI